MEPRTSQDNLSCLLICLLVHLDLSAPLQVCGNSSAGLGNTPVHRGRIELSESSLPSR